jgi:hypothetical protein
MRVSLQGERVRSAREREEHQRANHWKREDVLLGAVYSLRHGRRPRRQLCVFDFNYTIASKKDMSCLKASTSAQ